VQLVQCLAKEADFFLIFDRKPAGNHSRFKLLVRILSKEKKDFLFKIVEYGFCHNSKCESVIEASFICQSFIFRVFACDFSLDLEK